MKKLIICLFILVWSIPCFAQDIKKGFRGIPWDTHINKIRKSDQFEIHEASKYNNHIVTRINENLSIGKAQLEFIHYAFTSEEGLNNAKINDIDIGGKPDCFNVVLIKTKPGNGVLLAKELIGILGAPDSHKVDQGFEAQLHSALSNFGHGGGQMPETLKWYIGDIGLELTVIHQESDFMQVGKRDYADLMIYKTRKSRGGGF